MQEQLEATLKRYVAMPTVSNDVAVCRAAIQELQSEFAALGMTTVVDGPDHPWLVATPTAKAMRKKHVKVLLVVHFDVVPPSADDHFTLRATKDKLLGRGVYDMKFAAACYKQLIQELAEANELQQYDIGILVTTDEEKGGYDGTLHFLRRGWRCDVAVIPDGGWNWSIEGRAKGFVYLYLVAQGRSAHSSRPWTGDNPIHKLSPALHEIAKHFTNSDPNAVTVSINSVETSNANHLNTTQIPHLAKAGVSIRAFTEEEAQQAVTSIAATCKKYGLTIDTTLNEAPVHFTPDDPLVRQFMATAQEVHGAPIQISSAMGTSDARHFASHNIPTIVMYPNGGDHHGPHEWIQRDDLLKYYMLVKKYVQTVARIHKK